MLCDDLEGDIRINLEWVGEVRRPGGLVKMHTARFYLVHTSGEEN